MTKKELQRQIDILKLDIKEQEKRYLSLLEFLNIEEYEEAKIVTFERLSDYSVRALSKPEAVIVKKLRHNKNGKTNTKTE